MLRANHRRFLVLLVFTAGTWLVVLPWLAKTEAVESRARWLKDRGVVPSAFMYADHPVAARTLDGLDQIERENRGALWIPTALRSSLTAKTTDESR